MRAFILVCLLLATGGFAQAKPGERPRPKRVVVSQSTIVIYDHLRFPPGGAALPERAHPFLDAMAATLDGNPGLTRIEIQGHADPGESGDLLALSRARAEAVVVYLVGKGVAPGRVTPRGFAASAPAKPIAGQDQRSLNRRVELVIVDRVP